MNLISKCTNKEVELLKKAGVDITEKDYIIEELKSVEREITEYIMNHSSKNGDIGKLQNEYQSIFRTLEIK